MKPLVGVGANTDIGHPGYDEKLVSYVVSLAVVVMFLRSADTNTPLILVFIYCLFAYTIHESFTRGVSLANIHLAFNVHVTSNVVNNRVEQQGKHQEELQYIEKDVVVTKKPIIDLTA